MVSERVLTEPGREGVTVRHEIDKEPHSFASHPIQAVLGKATQGGSTRHALDFVSLHIDSWI